jgi:hypothetical protein
MLNAYMSNSQQGNVSGVQSLDAPNYGEQHLVSKFKAFLNSQQGNVSGVQSLDAPNYGEQHLVSKFKAFLNSQQGNVSGVQFLDAPNYGEQHLVSKFKAFLLMPWDPGGPKPLVRTTSMKPTIMKASTRHSPAAKKQPFIGTLKSLANCSFSKVSPGQPSILELWSDYIDIVLQVSHTAVCLEAFHLHSACTTCHVSISTMSDKFCDTGGMSCLGQIAETSSVLRFLLATDPSNHLLSGKESVLLIEDEACVVQNPFGIFFSDNTSVLLYTDESCDVMHCLQREMLCYYVSF